MARATAGIGISRDFSIDYFPSVSPPTNGSPFWPLSVVVVIAPTSLGSWGAAHAAPSALIAFITRSAAHRPASFK